MLDETYFKYEKPKGITKKKNLLYSGSNEGQSTQHTSDDQRKPLIKKDKDQFLSDGDVKDI